MLFLEVKDLNHECIVRSKLVRLCVMRNEVKNFLKFNSSKGGAFDPATPFEKLLSVTMLVEGGSWV